MIKLLKVLTHSRDIILEHNRLFERRVTSLEIACNVVDCFFTQKQPVRMQASRQNFN